MCFGHNLLCYPHRDLDEAGIVGSKHVPIDPCHHLVIAPLKPIQSRLVLHPALFSSLLDHLQRNLGCDLSNVLQVGVDVALFQVVFLDQAGEGNSCGGE